MKTFIRIAVVAASIAMIGCASSQSMAQVPAPTTPAATQVANAPAQTKTTYKGSEGVRELLHAMQNKTVPAGIVEVEAKADEVLTGSLDSLIDTSAHEGPAKALMMALEAGQKMPADLQRSVSETVVTTYNSWVVVCSGISEQRIPEWTSAVMNRVARGDEAGANEATKLQISSELRVERLVNPGWLDSVAWWWSR